MVKLREWPTRREMGSDMIEFIVQSVDLILQCRYVRGHILVFLRLFEARTTVLQSEQLACYRHGEPRLSMYSQVRRHTRG